MKFTEKLTAHLTSEWRQQYIAYADLKSMILNALENAPLKAISTGRTVDNYYAKFEEEFFFECRKELQKINTFYAEKLAEATRRNEVLSIALDEIIGEFRLRMRTLSRRNVHQETFIRKFKQKKAKLTDLKNGFSELYLSLVLLQNYKMLNHTGFKKILKKHDKLLNNDRGAKWFDENVSAANFFNNNDVERLMKEVEQNFTEYLENGDRGQAMKRLRVPPLEEIQEVGTVFRVGLFLGAFIVLLGIILIIAVNGNLNENSQSKQDLILFRAPFYVIMYLFLMGINVFTWRRAGVNHILIFEINPRKHLTYSHLLELHSIFGFFWCLCLLWFIYADKISTPKLFTPLFLIGIMLMFLFNPLPILKRNARYWLLRLMNYGSNLIFLKWLIVLTAVEGYFLKGRVILAPLFTVGFADFWFGDQLNSMVACLLDFKYLFCFYANYFSGKEDFQTNQCLERDFIGNAVVRCLPSWFRFAQCLRRYWDSGQVHPFLVNAGKYAATFPMVIFFTLSSKYKDNYEYAFQNPFIWFYIVFAIFQTCYCCCWDILNDFGLFKTFSGKNIFLREHIIYPPVFYYFAIFENILLRFFWAISLYLVTQNYISIYNMDSLAGCLEIIRRYIWNYIRLENEHLYNVGQFRAVRDIFITPIKSKNTIEIQKMMDEDNGVLNRKTSKINNINLIDCNEELEDE